MQIKESLYTSTFLTINDTQQFVIIKTKDINNPVLLIVHGETTETPHFIKFNKQLEKNFTVIYWDQRGCGKSTKIDPNTFTLDQYIEDIHQLILYLKNKFHQEKIYLLAHSVGTLLAIETINKYPNNILCI